MGHGLDQGSGSMIYSDAAVAYLAKGANWKSWTWIVLDLATNPRERERTSDLRCLRCNIGSKEWGTKKVKHLCALIVWRHKERNSKKCSST